MTTVANNNRRTSDKLGELIKWRQIADKLTHEQLLEHAYFTLKCLTVTQLKSVLFSGFLKCKEIIEYDQIFDMQQNLESYDILNDEKHDYTYDSNDDINVNEINAKKKMIPWLDMVPNDIILSNVCQCLWMKDIFNFSKCAHRYAIICHSPPAMNNFQLRIKGNNICSYENYFHNYRTDHRRLLGIQYLTIDFQNEGIFHVPNLLRNFFQQLKHVQHLKYTRNSTKNSIEYFAKPCFQELKSISFIDSYVSTEDLCWTLGSDQSLAEYNDEIRMDEKKEQNIFNSDIIYNLETIALNNCSFSENTFPYLYELLLPSKINKLYVLKLQDVNCEIDTNDKRHALKDENRIRRSLCNLRAFAAILCSEQSYFGDILSRKILSVLQFQLECIHIHDESTAPSTIDNFPFPFLMQKRYKSEKQKEILHLKELCISFPKKTERKDKVLRRICKNLSEDIFLTHVPNKNTGGLQKLCLTFPSVDVANVFVKEPLKRILRKSTALKFLEIKIDENYINIDFYRFFKCLHNSFSSIRDNSWIKKSLRAYHKKQRDLFTKNALAFKVTFDDHFSVPRHIYDMDVSYHLKKFIDVFLLTFADGLIQWKCKGLLIPDAVMANKTKYFVANEDSFSTIMNLNAYEKGIEHDTEWICDCK